MEPPIKYIDTAAPRTDHLHVELAAAPPAISSLHQATAVHGDGIRTLHDIANGLMTAPHHTSIQPSQNEPPPAFYITTETAQNLLRRPVSPVPAKRYEGFHHLTQYLRHVALLANTTMKSQLDADPLEVQASVVGPTLHMAANFHGDKILRALQRALNEPQVSGAREHVTGHQRRSWDDVIRSRRTRHLRKLQALCTSKLSLENTIQKARREIFASTGTEGAKLDRESIARQCATGLRTLQKALEDIRERGWSMHAQVHAPIYPETLLSQLPSVRSTTMHAELTIENYLAAHEEELYTAAVGHMNLDVGQHVIVPMAGRFVPCAVCKEVEHVAMQTGLFDPSRGRFILLRSSTRIGMAFPNEVQHFPLNALAPGDTQTALAHATHIRDRFIRSQEDLQSYDQPVVRAYSLDTDSEASSSE